MREIHLLFVVCGATVGLALLKFGAAYLLRCVAAFLAALADSLEFVCARTLEYRIAAGAGPREAVETLAENTPRAIGLGRIEA